MAFLTDTLPGTAAPIGQAFNRMGRKILNGLIVIAESSARCKQVERLNQLSDEELTARGTSREREIRRIFGVSYHI